MKKYFILALFIFIVISYIFYKKEDKNKELFASYYFWENSYKTEIKNEKLYIKVLDIYYSNQLEIIKTNFATKPPKEFIPVIYITNKTMQNINYKTLSQNILRALKSFDFNFNELQIDCDWSDSSRDNYFLFLNELKNSLNITFSSTIRLHQIKYFKKTGVPPVDYGVLMYYNMSNLGDFDTKNYILDNSEAKKYHYNFDKYPLRLKLALPLYSQAVQFRDKKAINLFENISSKDFKNENFIKIEENRYKTLSSHYFKGKYIYKDDIFRLEEPKEDELKTALKDFKELSKNSFNEVIFYTIKYKLKYNLEKILGE
ncbi:hypothetical protein [Aliarcobacter trophiarum]|uniref:hypothetical protein n=1 Tax=Aliarcobacter trophiarum TaxID=708186 RepID=UPI00100A3AE9|nr:hypothetical protein [Aliarcobacter trophiarum]RXI28614.1 hypothetical protein CRU89_01280 [Aliarcobacter trophiarum]